MEKDNLEIGMYLKKRYCVLKVLGIGGFGITYLAEDTDLQQNVVIKEYYPREIAGRIYDKDGNMNVVPREKDSRRRFLKGKKDFLKEARRMSKLFDIPEVVKVLDWFEENGTAYLAMEYIRGISLDNYLQNQDVPFSFQQAWKMLEPVAEALEKIHKTGIIHRDLNPGNLMMEENGTIKIIDFGSARPYLETEKTMTILIKKGYAPPEQYIKKGKQGPWTDVYALCATIYEMVTGVRPEPSIQRIEKDELYPPSAYGAEILPEEEELLFRGLEVNPKQRFRNMNEVCCALNNVQNPVKEGDVKIKQKRWIILLATAFTVVVLCTVGGTVFWLNMKDEPEKTQYAGSYGRQSDRYEEYVEFVESHAVSSQKEDDGDQGTKMIYTLKPEDVKKWGDPCNQVRFEYTKTDYLKWMKKNGYQLKRIKKSEKDTVEVRKYGAILTKFIKEEIFETETGLQIKVRQDSINEELFSIGMQVSDQKKTEVENVMRETAKFLTQEHSVTEEEITSEINDLKKTEQDEKWEKTGFCDLGGNYNYSLSIFRNKNTDVEWWFNVNILNVDAPEYLW
ncbi:serine/threonine protein kinase [Anaerostipes butyraticus]|uniref:serine/threonine protein kinase n=1 Tax=Anaerostipes butyraticus TaxID=645466 RepID=UPI00320A9D3F